MRSLRRIALVVFLCGVAIGYLYQHNCSLGTTRELDAALKERRVLVEEAARLRAEVEWLMSFGRLESLWVADGRPPLTEPATDVALTADESPVPVALSPMPELSAVERAQTDAHGVRVATATGSGIEMAEADGR